MNFKSYLRDKIIYILLFLFVYSTIFFLFLAFKLDSSLLVAVTFLLGVLFFSIFGIDYFRKKNFYTVLLTNIEKLDKAYFVLEMMEEPTFYEGRLLYGALSDINKSMCEAVKELENQTNDFKEYIELWIHEVKIPISSLVLIAHNHPNLFDKASLEQIRRIEDYVEQVLYYVRQEFSEKDYLINSVSLKKVISHIALKNKNELLENKIDLIVENVDYQIYTDSKWLEFMINQIVGNSMKYKKSKNSYIRISAWEESNGFVLKIEDNGIGIVESDLPLVFEKSFTGSNGRKKRKSTGMGLYIVKKLCSKLGHQIKIESKEGEYTSVFIIIAKNKYYEVVK